MEMQKILDCREEEVFESVEEVAPQVVEAGTAATPSTAAPAGPAPMCSPSRPVSAAAAGSPAVPRSPVDAIAAPPSPQKQGGAEGEVVATTDAQAQVHHTLPSLLHSAHFRKMDPSYD